MPPSGIPAPLPPWARALLQVAPLITPALQSVLQYIHQLQDPGGATPDEWRHVQQVFELAGNTEPAERWITTHDIVNITQSKVDSTWTDADYATVEQHLSSIAIAHLATCDSNVTYREARYYRRSFTPVPTPPYPEKWPPAFNKSGSPERIFLHGTPGALTPANGGARQIARTSTDKTAYARHWGRNYWPKPSAQAMQTDGYFASVSTDTFGNSLKGAYSNLMTAEFFPVVVVTQIDHVPARALLTVSGIQVDDIPDVVRRRRPRTSKHKYVAVVP